MHAQPPDGPFRCEGKIERQLRSRGFRAIAGVDEVGRGALFGPVVAAAVVLSPDRPIRGLNDSKQLDAERREILAARIRERAQCWAIAAVDAATIDSINIYQATLLARRKAVGRLAPKPDFLLIDALSLGLPIPQRALIKGDARCHAIAAASIIAKVYRDACMRVWDGMFPEYGLLNHKGYSTAEHQRALVRLGPTPLHRLSFEPVRAASPFPIGVDPDAAHQLELFQVAGAVS
jgi:ribonuclease HII